MFCKVFRNDTIKEVPYTTDAKRSLYSMLEFGAGHASGKAEALQYFNTSISYEKLLELVKTCAAGFVKLGVKKGDFVTICLPNIPQCVIAVYAVNRIGAVCNLVHPLSTKDEIEYAVNLTKSRFILTFEMNEGHCRDLDAAVIRCRTPQYFPKSPKGFVLKTIYHQKVKNEPKLDNVVEWTDLLAGGAGITLPEDTVKPEDIAAIMYTGGTTGQSKGVMLSNQAINYTSSWLVRYYTTGDSHIGDAILAILPVFHAFGLAVVINVPLSAGLRVILVPRFNPKDCAKIIRREKTAYLAGVPVMYERMYPFLKGHDCSFVKHAVCGGDKVGEDLLNRYNELLGDETGRWKFQPGFGLTEACGAFAVTRKEYHSFIDGSVGKPFDGIDICLVEPGTTEVLPNTEEGELCLRGPSLMSGYFENEQATAEVFRKHDDGLVWLHTGDVVTLTEDNTIVFRSRYKRMVKINGINVYPTLIENTMEKCEPIAEVCAVAVPFKNDRRIKLYVTLKDKKADEEAVKEEIMAYARANLNHWSCPISVAVLDEMPQTKMNKTDYRILEKRG